MEKWFMTLLMACSNRQAAHIQLCPVGVSHFGASQVGMREEPELMEEIQNQVRYDVLGKVGSE